MGGGGCEDGERLFGIGQLTHEADAAAPVDETKAPAGHQSSKGAGSVEVATISGI